ncbi:MAG: C2 family cysteine protease [Candidatus Gastranaerophilales bacterium]|nr:C2 family cysteine protease [Candidatus Gastranaerophilales bacterium]
MLLTGINENYNYNNDEQRTIGYSSQRMQSDFSETIYGIFNDEDKGVNGEIDEGVFQGKTGDCWLISGVLSLSYTEEGSEIIKNAISQNENGDYEVYFKGAGKTYTVTKEELEEVNVGTILSGLGIKNSTYSTGDDDMLLIELALEKLVDEGEVSIVTGDGITGGSAYYLYELLTGNNVEYAYGDDADEVLELFDYYEENQDTTAATLGVEDGFSGLEDSHAYAVKSYDGDTMTLVNPWDSTSEIEISTEDLLENMGSYDFSLVDNDTTSIAYA